MQDIRVARRPRVPQMPPNIEFIVTTGDSGADAKIANRRTARSFVTARHYEKKRVKAVLEHKSKTAGTRKLGSARDAYLPQEFAKYASSELRNEAVDVANEEQFSELLKYAHWQTNPQLQTPLPYYLGQGTSDPFVKLPVTIPPHMQRHIFYCSYEKW